MKARDALLILTAMNFFMMVCFNIGSHPEDQIFRTVGLVVDTIQLILVLIYALRDQYKETRRLVASLKGETYGKH